MNPAEEEFKSRRLQWERFERWRAHADPARLMSSAEALHWAGEMLDWHVARFGRPSAPACREDYAGIHIMRDRLARLTPSR